MAESFQQKRNAIMDAITHEWRSIVDIARDARMSQGETLAHLGDLIAMHGSIESDGGGRRSVRYRLRPRRTLAADERG